MRRRGGGVGVRRLRRRLRREPVESESESDESELVSDEESESESVSEESESEDDDDASSIARRCSMINLGAFWEVTFSEHIKGRDNRQKFKRTVRYSLISPVITPSPILVK